MASKEITEKEIDNLLDSVEELINYLEKSKQNISPSLNLRIEGVKESLEPFYGEETEEG